MLVDAPFGLRPVYHPSGDVRVEQHANGIASGFGTAIFTGTPIKKATDGTIIPCAVGADVCIGVFAGCQFISGNRPFILPYWPAGQTYDVNTRMVALWNPIDAVAEWEGLANGPVPQTAWGEGINLADASAGSIYTGLSSQHLNATVTGATPATFIVTGLPQYPDNTWGDAFTLLRVRISTVQGQVA
jgi:hypothetical protein